ncbi:MAG: hypothetical protein R3D30_13970 [Hyphomicrobiales bacterium]
MVKLKHLPLSEWPAADRDAFARAYEPGDIFDETAGPGAHLAEGTRRIVRTAYRRWLGFLKSHHPDDLQLPPPDRITLDRVRAFIEHLAAEVKSTSVAMAIDSLCYAARLIAPSRDWAWLAAIEARLAARAKPEDRFQRLVPAWQTLDLGIELMDQALGSDGEAHKRRELQYRDGLILALLSVWPIRRRSIAALTVSRHIELVDGGMNLLLHPEDTKAKRAESFRVPDQLLPYVLRYLREIRPRLVGRHEHNGFWASYRGRSLTACQIYNIVRALVTARFGKAMSLHDFRRAAATFVATHAPDRIGLVPGVLQHASPDVSEQHYNLARSVEAARRFAAHLSRARAKLRPIRLRNEA